MKHTHISKKTRQNFTSSKICIYIYFLFLILIGILVLHEVFFSRVKMQSECPLSHEHGAPERQGCMGSTESTTISHLTLLASKLRDPELVMVHLFLLVSEHKMA